MVQVHGLDLASLGDPLLFPWVVPLAVPLRVNHKQVTKVKEISDPQQAHSLSQDLALANGKDQTLLLAQSHDQANRGGQQQGRSSCLQLCWVQVRLHEKKEQQQGVMVVGKN